MGGGGGHGAFLRKDANLRDVDSVEESQKNLELFDERSNTFLGEDAGEKLKEGNTEANGFTAIGYKALSKLETGADNTAVGDLAMSEATVEQKNNTAVGWGSLKDNQGDDNTAVGNGTLYENTTGYSNVAVGSGALLKNKDGFKNTALGTSSLTSNISGVDNVASGYLSLFSNTSGEANVAVGARAGYWNTTGNKNTALGHEAVNNNSIGVENVGIGYHALYQTKADITQETAVGAYALQKDQGGHNTAIGWNAMSGDLTDLAGKNTAVGFKSLAFNTSGAKNTAVGSEALLNNKAGYNNIAIGEGAMWNNVTGNSNIVIGQDIALPNTSTDGMIQIGTAENTKTFFGATNVDVPSAIRDASGDEDNGFQLYVLASGEIVRGDTAVPI
jgi:trimeric autotransporter adhesin